MINTIIDIFHGDATNLATAKSEGIIGVIHKATQGSGFVDASYKLRKATANELGLLWGAYHFGTGDDVETQVHHFLQVAEPDDHVLIALDFEKNNHGTTMTINQARDFVEITHEMIGRFPVIYGSDLLRESLGTSIDPVLKNCPLWYARFREDPIGIPPTFGDFTLHQFTDGHFGPQPHDTAGHPCDRNRFKGTEDDLRQQWPFIRR